MFGESVRSIVVSRLDLLSMAASSIALAVGSTGGTPWISSKNTVLVIFLDYSFPCCGVLIGSVPLNSLLVDIMTVAESWRTSQNP